jgi:tetratricopeptide (TPR) repeat protein
MKGAINNSLAALGHSLEICRSWNFQQNVPRVAAVLGCAYAAAGSVSEAMPLLKLANERAGNSRTRVQSAEGYLLVGKLEEARSLASQVIESSQIQGCRRHAALSLYVLAECLLHAEVPDMAKAEDHYGHAMDLAKELRMRPLVAHCHVGLGKLYRHAGNNEKAKTHLVNGVAMMREMKMGLWLERAEAELKELG